MLLHVFKFKLVSGGCKREQVCEIWVKCKIYPPSHSLWNSNETGRVFCEVLGKQGLPGKRGLKEKRANTWQLWTGHIITAVLCCAAPRVPQLKADGEREEQWWSEENGVWGMWGAQRCRHQGRAGVTSNQGARRWGPAEEFAEEQFSWQERNFMLRVGGSKGRDCKARMDVGSESGKCLDLRTALKGSGWGSSERTTQQNWIDKLSEGEGWRKMEG